MATRSPIFRWETLAPSRSTMPTPSCPGMNGGVGLTGQSPCAAWMSVWHSPDVCIRTRTWPAPGSGIETSRTSSGSVKLVTTAAFMSCPSVSESHSWSGVAAVRAAGGSRSVGLRPDRGFGSEQAHGLLIRADQHVLGLAVQVEHHPVVLPADAGDLVSAEGRSGRVQVVAVDPDPAGLDPAGHPRDAVRVSGPDARPQAVQGVVRD